MKYCTKCGAQVEDDALFCPKCGHKFVAEAEAEVVENPQPQPQAQAKPKKRNKEACEIAVIFCIVSMVLTGWWLIPLCWMIPMTVVLNRKLQNNEEISMTFKVCLLLFVSLIAGVILLICDENND